MYVSQKVLSTYLKWRSLFLLSHQWIIFSWKSQVSSILIFHTFPTALLLTAACTQDRAMGQLRAWNLHSSNYRQEITILISDSIPSPFFTSQASLPELFWAVTTLIFFFEKFFDLFWFFDFSAASNYWSSTVGRELRIRITQSDCQLFPNSADPSEKLKKWK